MPEKEIIAEVARVTKNPVAEGSNDTGLFTVEAKVSAQEYSQGAFIVRVLEPAELGNFQHEQGSLMQEGCFTFASVDVPIVGDQIKISLSPTIGSI
jgi:hypothetical protein